MRRGTAVTAACLVVVLAGAAAAQPASPVAARVETLIGLARTAREQGRFDTALACLREADRLTPFHGDLLVEYFWVAHRAAAPDAFTVGGRVLAARPSQRDVRDALIGMAAGVDEPRVAELARAGAGLEPRRALWPRRLAESAMRGRKFDEAARWYGEAMTSDDGTSNDRAQWAMALELAGRKDRAVVAWASVPEAITASRPEWAASRSRARRPRPAPARPSAPTRPLTPAEVVAASQRMLHRTPCDEAALEALERLAEPDAFLDAVAGRPVHCARHGDWVARAVERAIAVQAFDRALALAAPLSGPGGPVAVREQYGVVLHWSGRHADAEPVLRDVATESMSARAVTALVEVRRALGDSDGAWSVAMARWHDSPAPSKRVVLAELALETGRPGEALRLARDVEHDGPMGIRAAAVEGGALLALGRAAEARAVLDTVATHPGATLAWLDAIAATEGIAAAVERAAGLRMADTPQHAEVQARLAVWQLRLGHRDRAASLALDVRTRNAARGQLLDAELALAAGRPGAAESTLREILASMPAEWRATDGLATALAEQERWDEALGVLDTLRARRPHDPRLAVLDAEWRHRRAPGAETLARLESVVAAASTADGNSALARALFRAGEYGRIANVLGRADGLADHDLILLAKSLRAAGRTDEALTALRTRPVAVVEAVLLAAELEAAVHGPAAVEAPFVELTARADADPAWFSAWADLQESGAATVRVLERASARFPADAAMQERLALAAWAERNTAVAARAADLALAADAGRTGAWFVKADLLGRAGQTGPLEALLSAFEATFESGSSARIGMAEMLAGLARSPHDAAALRALGWMDAALARDATHTTATVARARLLSALGRVDQALTSIEALLQARPDLPAVLKLRAELLAAATRYAEAVVAYEHYLARVPDDHPARRQQARVDGWRGAFSDALSRYETLRRRAPEWAAVAEEMAAKRAYYQGRWDEALVHYDAWLALEPDDVEAALERAQVYDHLGRPRRAAEAFRAVAARVAPNDVALTAADRLDRRRAAGADLFADAQSADAVTRQQVLDLVDAGAAYADDFGLGYGTRVRIAGGPSFAEDRDQSWTGHHVGAQVAALVTPSVGMTAGATYRALDSLDGAWFGDVGITWRARPSWRLSAGVERWLLLENGLTLEDGTSGRGPTMSAQWTPSADLRVRVDGAWSVQSDGNRRQRLRLAASERVLRGTHELHLLGTTERLGYRDRRAAYFTPSSFWRHDVGAEWRGWLATPRFHGDRERWVSATYLFGFDDRRETYQTARFGLSYELANGVGVVADGQVVRSRVYDGARLSVGLRLRQVPLPRP